MTKLDYFKYIFNSSPNRECVKIRWYFACFTLCDDNEFVRKNGLRYEVVIERNGTKTNEIITDSDASKPLLEPNLKIKIGPDDLPLLCKEPTETTIGRYIFNYLYYYNILKPYNEELLKEVTYLNKETGLSPVENTYNKLLREDKINVEIYGKFIDTCSFLQDLSRIFTVVCTYKNITPPPGLDKYKKELSKKFDAEYGPKWRDNLQLVASYTDELMKLDKEYLKDDRSTGKIMIPKVTENARVKMYISFGLDRGMDPNSVFVENSLTDGYPKNKEELAAIYNSIIAGSYSRGAETVKGGVLAKALLRSGLNCVIREGDCGTNLYSEILITKENFKSYNDRNMVTPNGLVNIDNAEEFIGQTIKVRSPLYCRHEGKNFCSACVGKAIGDRKFGIPLLLTDIGGTILNSSMKAMHDTSIKKIRVTMEDIIK